MKDLRCGDRVVFDIHNGQRDDFNFKGLSTYVGVIITDHKDNTYDVLYYTDYGYNVVFNITDDNILPISEIEYEKTRIIVHYENLIKEEKLKLKTVIQEEKDREKAKRYNDIKYRIIKNCEWCIQSDLYDEDFINRVKEIANLKKQLFSPDKLPCISEIHRYNGTIKYKIRELEREKNNILDRLSDEKIKLRFK